MEGEGLSYRGAVPQSHILKGHPSSWLNNPPPFPIRKAFTGLSSSPFSYPHPWVLS